MSKIKAALSVSLIASLLLTVAIGLNLSPWLRGDDDWRWDYFAPTLNIGLLIACVVFTLYLLIASRIIRNGSARQAMWLAFIASLVLPFTTQLINQLDPLAELLLRTADPFLGGYLDIALNAGSLGDFLQQFPANAPDWNPHPQRHPPGQILIFMGLIRLFEQLPTAATTTALALQPWRCDYWPLLYRSNPEYAAVTGTFLIIALNALTVFPFAKLSRRLFPTRELAPLLLLFPLIPAFSLMNGYWDVALVIFSISGFWLVEEGLQRRHWWLWALAGIVFAIGVFMTHALLVAVAAAGIYTLLTIWRERNSGAWSLRRIVVSGGAFLGGLVALWGLYWLRYGVSYLDVYRANTEPHFEMQTNYFSRLFYNPYDFLLFLGFIIGAGALLALLHALVRPGDSQSQRGNHFVIAVWLTLILLTLSGISRAEVGRVWIFLMPFFALALGRLRLRDSKQWLLIYGVLIVQIVVMQSTLMERHPLPREFAVSADFLPLDAPLGEQLELAGWRIDQDVFTNGDTVDTQLAWRTLAMPTTSYTRFVHLYNPDNGVVAQSDSFPRSGQYHTTCWRDGEIVDERVAFEIGPDVPAGEYQLLVGMYPSDNPSTRLPTFGQNVIEGTILLTDSIEIR